MKRNIWIAVIFLSVAALMGFSKSVPQKTARNLKVMTYNIWNGFDWGKDTLRHEEWIAWVQDKNPDVLALQELCGFTEEKLRADAAKWGHQYVQILKTEGYPTGLTSREPIVLKERISEGFWHGLLHCETYGIDFFVVHLSPADFDFRLKEADVIMNKIKALDSDQYFILGDFNAHSPFDEELQKNNQSLLEKYRKSTSEQYSNLRLGEFDYSVISKFISIPAIDVSLKFIDITERYTYPSPVLIGSWRENMEDVRQTRERIDYILTSPNLAKSCTNVTIYNKGEAETLSDHYPMMAEFSFDSQ